MADVWHGSTKVRPFALEAVYGGGVCGMGLQHRYVAESINVR